MALLELSPCRPDRTKGQGAHGHAVQFVTILEAVAIFPKQNLKRVAMLLQDRSSLRKSILVHVVAVDAVERLVGIQYSYRGVGGKTHPHLEVARVR